MVDDLSAYQNDTAKQIESIQSPYPVPNTLFMPQDHYEWILSQVRLGDEKFDEETEEAEEEGVTNG